MPVQRLGHQFLAGPGLARDEHGHAGTREPADGAEYLLHGRRPTNQFRHAGAQVCPRGFAIVISGGTMDQGNGLVHIERFWQILECTAAVRGHRAVQVGVRGRYDDRQTGSFATQDCQQIQPGNPGHADIGQQYVGLIGRRVIGPVQCREQSVAIFERADMHPGLATGFLQHPAYRWIVVRQPDFQCLVQARASARVIVDTPSSALPVSAAVSVAGYIGSSI
ncbi:hypothetical protein MnTg04_00867 [bacterium MnTg04]|nr:hypothetical protein MnTg04_00867 [bacterium MnTg04]